MVHFAPHLSGTVEGVSLADMLQIFHYGKKSVTVHVGGQPSGRVVLMLGEIYHAECGDCEGEPALAKLMEQTQVRIRTSPLEVAPRHTIDRSFNAVVLDIARARDEHERDTLDLASPKVPIEEPRDEPSNLEARLRAWVRAQAGVEHAALIEPTRHEVLACDSDALWESLVKTSVLQSLCAPYFDDAFSEVEAALGNRGLGRDHERLTMVTFGAHRAVLAMVPSRSWLAVLFCSADEVSAGLAMAHMSSFQKALPSWGG